MGKPGRPGPTLDDYLYWQERFENRKASGLSIDEFCVAEAFRGQRIGVGSSDFVRAYRILSGKRGMVRHWLK